jgi:hypothetical protein
MKHLELEANNILFRFVANSGESRATLDANIFQDSWSSSLTVAVIEAEDLNMNDLIKTCSSLLKSGFGGWVIAETAPQTLTSFRILAAREGDSEALLTVTIGFKVMMPKDLR